MTDENEGQPDRSERTIRGLLADGAFTPEDFVSSMMKPGPPTPNIAQQLRDVPAPRQMSNPIPTSHFDRDRQARQTNEHLSKLLEVISLLSDQNELLKQQRDDAVVAAEKSAKHARNSLGLAWAAIGVTVAVGIAQIIVSIVTAT